MNESGGERCLGGSSHKGVLGLGWPAISSGSPIIAMSLKKNLTFTYFYHLICPVRCPSGHNVQRKQVLFPSYVKSHIVLFIPSLRVDTSSL